MKSFKEEVLLGSTATTVSLEVDHGVLYEDSAVSAVVRRHSDDLSSAITVKLSTDSQSQVSIPESVTIRAGEVSSDSFLIYGLSDQVLEGRQTVAITASVFGDSMETVDDFSSSDADAFWMLFRENPDASIIQEDGVLAILSEGAGASYLNSGLESKEVFAISDFDASVEFRLLQGEALPFLSLRQPPLSEIDPQGFSVYLERGLAYRTWQDNNTIVGNVFGREAFSDEAIQWHRLRLTYHANTGTARSYIDDQLLSEFTVQLDSVNVAIYVKDHRLYGPTATKVEFDNFRFVTTPLLHSDTRVLELFNVSEFESPWQRKDLPFDVDGDGRVLPLDALTLINLLNRRDKIDEQGRFIGVPAALQLPDVNGNRRLDPIDALIVINHLNESIQREAEATLSVLSDFTKELFSTSDTKEDASSEVSVGKLPFC